MLENKKTLFQRNSIISRKFMAKSKRAYNLEYDERFPDNIFHVPFFWFEYRDSSRFLCTFFNILKNNAYLVILLCSQTWCSRWIGFRHFSPRSFQNIFYTSSYLLYREQDQFPAVSVPIIGVYELKILHL